MKQIKTFVVMSIELKKLDESNIKIWLDKSGENEHDKPILQLTIQFNERYQVILVQLENMVF